MTTKHLNRIYPLSREKVTIHDAFWAPRQEINRTKTIPYQYRQCKRTGRIDAFHLDWTPGKKKPHIFWDSDAAKWIEAASYSLTHHPDSELEVLVDDVIDLIVSAQQDDGYLNIYYTAVEPEKRWTDLEGGHELYCAGHMIEGAVAYYEVTGKRKLLDAVCRYADYIASVFGTEEGKMKGYPGHEEIELALIKLYRVTQNEKYLELSRYFVDERGTSPHYFDMERQARNHEGHLKPVVGHLEGEDVNKYHQSHLPVREQEHAEGHSVRAMYLYSAMADLAYEIGDENLFNTCKRLWSHLVHKRMYITGGIGSSEKNEGFTSDYDLPNETSYAETCAAIGLVFWNHRMVQYECDSKYTDLLERALYNAVLAGVSLDGEKFFYANPLESKGDKHRSEWFDVACCPPNLSRLLASLEEYIYSESDHDLIVHLYVQSRLQTELAGKKVTIEQTSNYPWEPQVDFAIQLQEKARFGLKLRIPNWTSRYRLEVNGEETDEGVTLEHGYVRIERDWQDGDTVSLTMDMPVFRNYAHPAVKDAVGKVALQRGPLIYCLEQADHEASVFAVELPESSDFQVVFEEDVLNGIAAIEAKAYARTSASEELYQTDKSFKETAIKAIPYFAWDNREDGAMVVWMKEY
ncbi:glycoside hydrolase family 127 protein [Halobacillus salinarum]|uniref:Glycoside hydrolase family 127 protein n=1 Tax=Halobacillus salinarum TaxID=2932257 RepID=A0ABY4ELV5_9BACI|nr:beta-L-arabinofuranosidase domain-containing protein [Halobacillus salinarum]UOQ45426.1 glycoside hydrolase family 127 protein [Halobacillus salinarum]